MYNMTWCNCFTAKVSVSNFKVEKGENFEDAFYVFYAVFDITLQTRKPCCRKETARCRKCSFPLKFANNIHYKYKTS